jgi:hypothetical protein
MHNLNGSVEDFFNEFSIRCALDSPFDVFQLRKIYEEGIRANDVKYECFMRKIEEKNDPELVSFYECREEEWHLQDELFNYLCVVGLYIDVELFLKMILKYHFKIDKNEVDGYGYTEIRKRYGSKNIKIKLSSLNSFKKFNELRLLNNSIKHNGCVSKALENKYSAKWKFGEKIKISKDDIEEFAQKLSDFKHSLFDKIKVNFKYK